MSNRSALFTLISTALLASAAVAAPQGSKELQRVEVSGTAEPAVRTDVRAACPDVVTEMQKRLANVSYRVGREAELTVDLKLNGNAIENVSVQGGPREYRSDTRSAVWQLQCSTPQASSQLYRFVVAFVSEDKAAQSGGRVALRSVNGKTL